MKMASFATNQRKACIFTRAFVFHALRVLGFTSPHRLVEFLRLHAHGPITGPYLSLGILQIDFSGFTTSCHHHFNGRALFMCSRFVILCFKLFLYSFYIFSDVNVVVVLTFTFIILHKRALIFCKHKLIERKNT